MSTAPAPQRGPLERTAREGGDACPGALRLHPADDGALARVRVPGGVLTDRQADALGEAASRLGDGVLHLTSRGNVQLRGVGEGCGRELAALLDAAGLLPSFAHERVRNVVASPLSGLDGRGAADVRPWLTELDALLCASGAARGLSGRFLFALDDGRGDVAALGADVTLTAVAGGGALLRLGAGGLADGVLRLPGGAAARGALLAAESFLDAARGAAWRMSDLPGPVGELAAEVGRRLAAEGVEAVRERGAAPGGGGGPAPGVVPGAVDGRAALSVLAPLGRISAAQWELLAGCARADGSGELRLTPWRGVVVPGVAGGRAPGRLADLAASGLVTDPASPWVGVGACIGRPGCAKSLADVRGDAGEAVAAVEAVRGPAGGGLPVYWSGCERRCGRPAADHVDVVAGVGGYRVGVRGVAAAVGRRDLPTAVERARATAP
ncbi:precorrin-3B synthase [Streptomyces sp. NPDC001889]